MRRLSFGAILALLGLLCACGDDGPRRPSAPINVAISPSTSQTMVQGQLMNLSATMSNDSAQKGVTWTVAGTTCTGSACGTLSNATATTVTYNAPASVSGNLIVTVVATSVSDASKSASVSITVVPVPSISTTSLPGGTHNATYAPVALTGSGGIAPLTWSISAGALPTGLALNGTTGVISGTPTAIETANFTVRVADASTPPVTATKALSIVISPALLTITTGSLTPATVDSSYAVTLQASGGTVPITWTVTAGSLPAGLTLHAGTGVIDGIPSAAGTAAFTVTATDSATPTPQTTSRNLSITVNSILAITTASMPNGTANTAYSTPLMSSGGTAPIAWTVSQGTLPAGLNLNSSTGIISGTPTTLGTANFTIQAADSSTPQQTATLPTSITITAAPLAITTASLPNATIGNAYSTSVQATGGTPPITWTVTLGSLPTWASLDAATGAITGTPTGSPTTTNFTVTATDSASNPQTQSRALSVTTLAAGANNGELNGHYAFIAQGFTSNGEAATMAGSFTANGTGLITGGVADINTLSATQTNVAVTGGSYSIGTDQRGTLSLTTAQSTLDFLFAVGGISSGVASRGRLVTSGTTVASGVLKKQDSAAFTAGSIAGTFVGAMHGAERQPAGARQAALALLTFDGTNAFTATGEANDAGTFTPMLFGGTYDATDTTNGRFVLNDTTNGSHMAVYVVSANEAMVINIDPALAPIFVGTAIRQSGTFDNGSLNGAAILATQALGTGPRADITLLTADGTGNYTLLPDTNRGGTFTSGPPQTGTYAINATGKVTVTGGPVIYLVGPNTGFLVGTDAKVETGFIEAQTGGPFDNTSVTGNFYYGNESPVVQSALGCGVIAANGGAGITGTSDENTSGTITSSPISDTIVVASDGHVTLNGAVMYIISPTKAVKMETTNPIPVITVIEK